MIPHEKKQFPIINKQVGRAGVYHSQKEKEKKEGFFMFSITESYKKYA